MNKKAKINWICTHHNHPQRLTTKADAVAHASNCSHCFLTIALPWGKFPHGIVWNEDSMLKYFLKHKVIHFLTQTSFKIEYNFLSSVSRSRK
jgi:hypothetical protein